MKNDVTCQACVYILPSESVAITRKETFAIASRTRRIERKIDSFLSAINRQSIHRAMKED